MLIKDKNLETRNYLRAINFERPEWIPCRVWIYPATWKKYREKLEDIVLSYPRLFPEYKQGGGNFEIISNPSYKKGILIDVWGCVWKNVIEGLQGQVIGHPLDNWNKLENFDVPNPLTHDQWGTPLNWEKRKKFLQEDKKKGRLARGNLPHGFMFQYLYYLRGFENLMIDIATNNSNLWHLIDIVLEYNKHLIHKWIEIGAEWIVFGDDLGTQTALMIHPRHWRQYLKPCYKQIFTICQNAGVGIYMHSDGHILEILEDLIDEGVNIINPQIQANDLQELKKKCKGRVFIDATLNSQFFPFATPKQIKEYVQEVIEILDSKEGGSMLSAEWTPDMSLESINTICEAFEKYCLGISSHTLGGRTYLG